jgi:site-specific DNA recombinase
MLSSQHNLGVRLFGELRMKGVEADKIADALNEAGYRTGSKRFGARLFTKDTVTAMLRNEFYAAYAPGDDRGTVKYKEQRYRGLHPAIFTYDEWQQIRAMTHSMHHASTRTEQVKHVYQSAGSISCIHCGLKLRCDTGNTPDNRRQYYRDAAKARRLPCPAGGNLMVRIDLVDEQFGDLLKSLQLPENWREVIRRDMVAQALAAGVTPETVEREKERLKLKKSRTIKLYKEGYIDEEEFQGEMAAVELALKQLDAPEVDGVTYDEVIEAGEHLPGMAALWDVATVEERYEMVSIALEPGGLYYDLETKIIAAIKPRPAFLPVLRMLNGIVEFDETRGLLVTDHWCERNRRASDDLQDAQRDRQTRLASSSSERLVIFLLCLVFQERMVQAASTAGSVIIGTLLKRMSQVASTPFRQLLEKQTGALLGSPQVERRIDTNRCASCFSRAVATGR